MLSVEKKIHRPEFLNPRDLNRIINRENFVIPSTEDVLPLPQKVKKSIFMIDMKELF